MVDWEYYYFYSYSFADAMSPEIASRIVGHDISTVNGCKWNATKKRGVQKWWGRISGKRHANRQNTKRVLGLGSIVHHARSQDTIWGSGVNPYWQDGVETGVPNEILALRGPLSKDYLESKYGLEIKCAFGDPALLLPKLFPEFSTLGKCDVLTVLAQHNDEFMIEEFVGAEFSSSVYLCQRINRKPWREVLGRILNSEYVISSSLHGLILADAFGVPSRWLHSRELPSVISEGRFKFNDYYLSTGRKENCFASSIKEALSMGPVEQPGMVDIDALIRSFPIEKFT